MGKNKDGGYRPLKNPGMISHKRDSVEQVREKGAITTEMRSQEAMEKKSQNKENETKSWREIISSERTDKKEQTESKIQEEKKPENQKLYRPKIDQAKEEFIKNKGLEPTDKNKDQSKSPEKDNPDNSPDKDK